ncbi:MAG: NACHT domain-containing protein [Leptolyngbyaceae cyanobacterium MO_188.B28]|nr:NACHT domain-containing protein [Leptolyngbyaceae cyanobacterium MO_188.B28]
MNEEQPPEHNQELNIADSVFDRVQIGGIAGRDLSVMQNQRVYVTNVFNEVQVDPASTGASQSLTRQEYRWRQALLKRVKQSWIEGVLEKSLYVRVLIELGLEERKNAVQNPLTDVEEFATEVAEAFPEGTDITDIFEQLGAGRTLLILGEPGAGKTVTLLKLAKSLITRTENALDQSLPVVMNLSSWARKKQPIAEWVVEELHRLYGMSKSLARAWVYQQKLILLLDGLDEVDIKCRHHCIKALNQFIQEHGITEIVVCSRIRDYMAISERLKLRTAIYIKPLTSRQVSQFLDSAGEQLSALRIILNKNSELQEFASSPLILSIMSLAYQNYSTDNIVQYKTMEEYHQGLFDTYINRMFEGARITAYTKQISRKKYPREKAQYWLVWLAKQMQRTSQSVFLIENIQPELLQTKLEGFLFRIIGIFIVCLSYLLLTQLIILPVSGFGGYQSLVMRTLIGLILGLSGGLKKTSTASLKGALFFGISLGLIISFISSSINAVFVFFGILFGGVMGAIGGGLMGGFFDVIEITEKFTWSWRNAYKGFRNLFFWGGVISSPITFLIALGSGQGFTKIIQSVVFSFLTNGIVLGFIGAFFGGLGRAKFYSSNKPNQGIYNSAINYLIGGLATGVIASLIMIAAFVFSIQFSDQLSEVFSSSSGESTFLELLMFIALGVLYLGFFIGIFTGLKYGGKVCLQHISLRIVLFVKGYVPWNCARFLDYASERIFMQRVGGGYIFVHRMLLEHFAQIELDQTRR